MWVLYKRQTPLLEVGERKETVGELKEKKKKKILNSEFVFLLGRRTEAHLWTHIQGRSRRA